MGALSFLLGVVSSFLVGVSCPSGVSLCRRPGGLVESLSLVKGRVVFSSGGILLFWWGILCRRPGGLVDSLSFLLGNRVVFFWGYPALLLEYPLSSSWWSCGKFVFSSRGWCLLVGYPFILGFLFGPFGLLTFGALGLIRRSRCATALPAMDNVATACHVSGTASPFPPLQWEDAAGGPNPRPPSCTGRGCPSAPYRQTMVSL